MNTRTNVLRAFEFSQTQFCVFMWLCKQNTVLSNQSAHYMAIVLLMYRVEPLLWDISIKGHFSLSRQNAHITFVFTISI